MDMKPIGELAVQWKEPPSPPVYRSPSHYRKAVLDWFRAELLKKPGEWAVLPTEGLQHALNDKTAYATVRNINKGYGAWASGSAWEARRVGSAVYVRSVGASD